MILEEAAKLLQLMRGTWPRLAQDEVADRLWLEDLTKLDPKPAYEAFRSLRDQEARTPSWALFLESYKVQNRPSLRELEAAPEDDWTPPSEDERRRIHALVNQLSAQLTGRAPRPFEPKPRA